jgi:hypothetical protein
VRGIYFLTFPDHTWTPRGGPRAHNGGIKMTTNTKMIPLQAILALVSYLEVDEGKHFDWKCAAGADTSDHIFHSVKAVSAWLDGQPGIPTAAEREQQRLAPLVEAFAAAGVRVADGDFRDFWDEQDAARRH